MKRPRHGSLYHWIYIELVQRKKSGVSKRQLFNGLCQRFNVPQETLRMVYQRYIAYNLKRHDLKELY
jgi:hypothetical protein